MVFDMDGVLVDPTQTFRRALIETVRHFCGREMSQADIVRVKNRGGYNDDSDIAMRAILEAGVDADEREVREFGRELYWGRAGEGYIRDERWLVSSGTLERLAANQRLGIFTGRGMRSTQHTPAPLLPAGSVRSDRHARASREAQACTGRPAKDRRGRARGRDRVRGR